MKPFSRRKFLKTTAAGLGTAVMGGCVKGPEWEELFQKRFQKMSGQEIEKMLSRLEKKYSKTYGIPFTVKATQAKEGTVFGYGLDLSRCIGCRRCVHACVKENNPSRDGC